MERRTALFAFPLAFCAFLSCSTKKEPTITIKVDPEFFRIHTTGPNMLGFEYFKTTLDGKDIMLTADQKKKIEISSTGDYASLDSLEIMKTKNLSDGIPVYFIERLIYFASKDTTKAK